MAENQNIEYKESWRDEYLKWICGFANANGGKITNSEYQANYGVARNTATRDLSELVDKGILQSSEAKGAGSYYEL